MNDTLFTWGAATDASAPAGATADTAISKPEVDAPSSEAGAVGQPPAAVAQSTRIGARRRRFRRDPSFKPEGSRAGRLVIGRRDLDMVAAIAAHRFLNTEHVIRLFACACPRVERPGMRAGRAVMISVKQHRDGCACSCASRQHKGEHAAGCPALFKDDQHVAHRLREVYQAGYLERPIAQLQLRVKDGVINPGSVPLVYCVTAAGLALIGSERREALGLGKMSWALKQNEGMRAFMEHTLAIADMSVGLDVAIRKRRELERFSEAALRASMIETRRNSPRPWGLKVRYRGEELSTICDLAFAVGHREARRRYNFLAEIDLGHMPVERADLSRTSIMRKLIGYAKVYEDGLHRSELGWKNFRVLILTTSPERVRSCITAAKARFGTASVGRLFLFATLDVARDPLSATYLDVDGNAHRLVELPASAQQGRP